MMLKFCCLFPGDVLSTKVVDLLTTYVVNDCRIWNVYGPAETTLASHYYLVDPTIQTKSIPLGRPLPNYPCLIFDEFLQPVPVGQQGELLIGGDGVFAGYLGREDLTQKALIEIDGQLFYRTGDLVRLDTDGNLHSIGRKDYQVKLRGQRIELGEIEQCLLSSSSHMSACAVIKWGDDHLVAYVQGSHVDEAQLHLYCHSHLPQFMIPSMFIVLDQFPLNSNGKLDRKRLPTPDFSSAYNRTADAPQSPLQKQVHALWCQILQRDSDQISTTASFFSIGGHSLLLMQLYHRYVTVFELDSNTLTIGQLFQHSTITDHARFIQLALHSPKHGYESWVSLHLNEGQVSFAQERIFLDERIRFSSQGNRMYTVPLLYRISPSNNHVS
ncbi:unnamed protein product, partial [Adineta ricciae]